MEKKENILNLRQKEILSFIDESIKKTGYPPSVREIAGAVGLSSTATVHAHLKNLESLGFIKKNPLQPRTISLSSDYENQYPGQNTNNIVFVPILGNIAAGTPILAEENISDYFPLTGEFLSGNKEIYMLQVKGDSMVNAGILDRDYVIVRKQEMAINGEIIVALVGSEEATVKRFFKNDNCVKLMPENNHMEPIVTKDVKVLGKVIGVIRKYF